MSRARTRLHVIIHEDCDVEMLLRSIDYARKI